MFWLRVASYMTRSQGNVSGESKRSEKDREFLLVCWRFARILIAIGS